MTYARRTQEAKECTLVAVSYTRIDFHWPTSFCGVCLRTRGPATRVASER